jgi:hypothetical protein
MSKDALSLPDDRCATINPGFVRSAQATLTAHRRRFRDIDRTKRSGSNVGKSD